MTGGAADELRTLLERGELILPHDRVAQEDWQHDALLISWVMAGCWIDAHWAAKSNIAVAVSRLTEPQPRVGE